MNKEYCKHEWRFLEKDANASLEFFYCIHCLTQAECKWGTLKISLVEYSIEE